jgi:hypothetical protein
MTSQQIARIGGVAIEEIFACLSIPGGATASAMLQKVFEKKAQEARAILLEEISQGGAPAMADDEAVYIIYRYLRAAQEGTARVNLRLLAQVIAGQRRADALKADEFLYYADIISSLRYEEIVLLGCIYKYIKTQTDEDKKDSVKSSVQAMEIAKKELVPTVFKTEEDWNACCAAILRTGLLAVSSGFGALLYKSTSLMDQLCEWASFEDALAKEQR